MTFLAPGYLLAAAAAALGVLLLHLIVTREPRTRPLPTARFAPDTSALARPRAVKPRDLLLLLLRAALVLLAGAALAQPIVAPARRPLVRIVLADSSWAVAAEAEVRDSIAGVAGDGDSVIRFTAGIAPALVQALRAASNLQARADSLEIVLVSPLLAAQLDPAVDSIRALWPGALRLVAVAARAAEPLPAVAFDGPAADPLRFPLAGRIRAAGELRLLRRRATAADSAAARDGAVVVEWPAGAPGSAAPAASGVSAGDVTVVALFGAADSVAVAGGTVVARWMDGSPAAVEWTAGAGCLRAVAIPVTERGDLVLTARFARLVARLTAPCGGHRDVTPAPPERIAALVSAQRPALVAAPAVAGLEVQRSSLGAWLLAAAVVLALLELLVRRAR